MELLIGILLIAYAVSLGKKDNIDNYNRGYQKGKEDSENEK